ncbi:excalibur calcium-binding domain-containing protein [Fictibacillus fluitans]|uniref:Excalibur calcium-binding domain-containing protein n=1 Tax=Fictibacillus fluitans TaxID=3058422 RepID=A0ABT8HVT0_9BACL|nr:excalibur calcium-binding domain-containing protein [Fictibacillus sp. NE201]MDN4524881.1 excalibur calcium-binding domain-containing protein [Fictibacillus sp. NE201]
MKRLAFVGIVALGVSSATGIQAEAAGSGDKNCSDFSSHQAVMEFWDNNGYNAKNDPHDLDRDSDGLPCEVSKSEYDSFLANKKDNSNDNSSNDSASDNSGNSDNSTNDNSNNSNTSSSNSNTGDSTSSSDGGEMPETASNQPIAAAGGALLAGMGALLAFARKKAR